MKRHRLFTLLTLVIVVPAFAVQTSHWTHTNEADFNKGTMHNVVATNLGDVKLSRAVKTLLEEDAKVSAVYAMVEAADGTVYAATGPHGVLLRLTKDGKSTPIATFDDNSNLFALLPDGSGGLYVGVSGEHGKVYRVEHPDAADVKPTEVFSDDDAQYVWNLARTPDGNLYVATGPNGKLFEVKPDGAKSVLLASDESNLLSLLSDGKDTLYVGTDPNGLVYRINRKTKDVFILFDAAESEVSCLALDKKGNLYVGTAEAAENPDANAKPAADVEKAGRPEGSGAVPLPSTPPSLPNPPAKPDPNPGEPDPIPKNADKGTRGNEDKGTRRPGDKGTKGSPEGEFAETETGMAVSSPCPLVPLSPCLLVASALLLDGSGLPNPNPGDKPKPGAPATQPNPPANPPPNLTPATEAPAAPKPQGNAIYRIDKDGFVTEIFRQPVLVLSMIEQDGTLLVGTGSDGLVYQVNPAAEETVVLAKVEPKQVLSLLPASDGRVLLGFANVGGIAAMSRGFAAEGTFTSPVMDATQISRFGKIHLQGSLPQGTSMTVATRSGNVQDPTKAGWSNWSDEAPAVEYFQVPSPSARFLQYRLTLASKEGKTTPVVDEVDVAYQTPNVAPVVKAVKVGQNGAAKNGGGNDIAALLNAATPGAPATADANRVQTVTWEAEDANGDSLQYSLYFRAGPKAPWILLKDKLTDAKYDWDTRAVADGRYELKVIASDALANPPGEGKTGSRVSDPVVVDNTPPTIGDVQTTVKGNGVAIKARAVDRTSIVADFAYSVDSSTDWQLVLPSNKMFDSPEEAVDFTVRGLSAGAHQVTLRATDAKGNQAFETVLVTVDAPTAGR